MHHILWKPDVHQHNHNSPASEPILKHMNAVCSLSAHFFQPNCNNIPFPNTVAPCVQFSRHTTVCRSPSPPSMCATFPPPPWSGQRNNISWAAHIMKLLIMQLSPVSCQFITLGPKYSLQRPMATSPQPAPFDRALNVCFTHNCMMSAEQFGWWNKEGWDGRDMLHELGRTEVQTGSGWGKLKKRDTSEDLVKDGRGWY